MDYRCEDWEWLWLVDVIIWVMTCWVAADDLWYPRVPSNPEAWQKMAAVFPTFTGDYILPTWLVVKSHYDIVKFLITILTKDISWLTRKGEMWICVWGAIWAIIYATWVIIVLCVTFCHAE